MTLNPYLPNYMQKDCCSGYPNCQHKPTIVNDEQSIRISKQIKNDLQILKDFILGFTARNVDKEWEAFKNIRTALCGEYD